jgi:hypothetical protein
MPLDPARIAEAKSWFKKAASRQCTSIDATLETLLKRAERLSVYAWAFRYPGDAEHPSLEEAQDAIAISREVVQTLLARLPAEIRG